MMIREVGGLDFDEVSPGMAEKADRIENGRVNEVVHLTVTGKHFTSYTEGIPLESVAYRYGRVSGVSFGCKGLQSLLYLVIGISMRLPIYEWQISWFYRKKRFICLVMTSE